MIRKRILQYLDLKGISKYKFYKDNAVSNGFLDKEGSIRSDICEKISYQYEDINLIWLITGKGEMLLQQQGLGALSESTLTQLQQELLSTKKLLEKEEQHTADLRELLNLQNNSKQNAS